MSIFTKLRNWRESRHITVGSYNHLQLVGYLTEEITEGIRDLSEHESVDWRADCIVFLVNSLEQSGYDAEKVLLETHLEINSRLQSPSQMKEWASNGADGKWKKDKDQNKSTLYKADYTKCFLN